MNAFTELIQVPDFTLDENRAIYAIFRDKSLSVQVLLAKLYYIFRCRVFGRAYRKCAVSREIRAIQ